MTTGQRNRRRILSGDNGCTWACRRARSSALGLAWYDTSHSGDTGDDKDGSMLGPTKQMSFRGNDDYKIYIPFQRSTPVSRMLRIAEWGEAQNAANQSSMASTEKPSELPRPY